MSSYDDIYEYIEAELENGASADEVSAEIIDMYRGVVSMDDIDEAEYRAEWESPYDVLDFLDGCDAPDDDDLLTHRSPGVYSGL